MFPAQRATCRCGGIAVMAAGGLIGAAAAWMAAHAASLGAMVAGQFIAGAAWGGMLMSALAAAIAMGRTGGFNHANRIGIATGGLFSLLAVATFARMTMVATQVNGAPGGYPVLLAWLPVAIWGWGFERVVMTFIGNEANKGFCSAANSRSIFSCSSNAKNLIRVACWGRVTAPVPASRHCVLSDPYG